MKEGEDFGDAMLNGALGSADVGDEAIGIGRNCGFEDKVGFCW